MSALCSWTERWYPFAAGYAFALVIGGVATWQLVRTLYGQQHQGFLSARVLGFVERAVYATGAYLGHYEFIGAWLVLKVAGSFGWRSDRGRDPYNIFLVGTGLSLFFGVVGGRLVVWLQRGDYDRALTIPSVLVVSALALVVYSNLSPRGRETYWNLPDDKPDA